MLDKFFKLSEKGTTVKTEILAGDNILSNGLYFSSQSSNAW